MSGAPLADQNPTAFYDERGVKVLASDDRAFGSARIRQHLSEPYRYFESLLRAIHCQSQGRELRLLDLCCGTGVHSVLPATLGFRVIGIDLSPKSIEAATRLAAMNGVQDRCQFVVGDAAKALATLGRFDVIICAESLYYFDVEMLLPLLRSALTPRGRFIAVETNGDNRPMAIYRRIKTAIYKHRDRTTLDHLMGRQSLAAFGRGLTLREVRYFDCLTLFGVALQRSPVVASGYAALARRVDAFLLNRLGVGHRLAFKFVVSAENEGR